METVVKPGTEQKGFLLCVRFSVRAPKGEVPKGPKFHEKTPKRGKHENCGGRGKKSEILGCPAEGGPGRGVGRRGVWRRGE